MTGSTTLADCLRELTGLDQALARTALASFGLNSEVAERGVTTLSPGERTRAELTVIAHQRATCLLLRLTFGARRNELAAAHPAARDNPHLGHRLESFR